MPARIAIVDDEPVTVDMFTTYLKIKGFEVVSAYTGREGLELVQDRNPDLLILDLMLPDIEGYEVCRLLREMPAYATLPILIISARADPMSMTRAEHSGANSYMTKPVRFPDLLEEIHRLLNR